jgi:putative FmdB family regulatory protein
MPTYTYVCQECNHTLDLFQRITEDPAKVCPKCEKPALKRKISAGAGLIFKGSGFYATDYRSDSYKQKLLAETGPAKETSGAKSDAAPAKETCGAKCDAGSAKETAGSAKDTGTKSDAGSKRCA